MSSTSNHDRKKPILARERHPSRPVQPLEHVFGLLEQTRKAVGELESMCTLSSVAATQRDVGVKMASRCVLLPAGIQLESRKTSSSLIYKTLGSSELYRA